MIPPERIMPQQAAPGRISGRRRRRGGVRFRRRRRNPPFSSISIGIDTGAGTGMSGGICNRAGVLTAAAEGNILCEGIEHLFYYRRARRRTGAGEDDR
jgi:hypothetical protein